MRFGDVHERKYRIVGKLGYGISSTVWLAHDLLEPRYVALKLFAPPSLINLVNLRSVKVWVQYNHQITLGRGLSASYSDLSR